jgi:hypothetical protein
VRDGEVEALYRVVVRFELLAYYVLNSPLNLQRTFGRAGVFCVTDNFTTTSLSSAPPQQRAAFSILVVGRRPDDTPKGNV